MGDIQQRVQELVDGLVTTGAERGVQVTAYRGAEVVVDVVAGVADPATGRLVTPDTPFYNFSIGKGAAATVLHILAERGEIAYDTRVAEVWPEFAAHGKDGVTVRHVLTHTAGVPGIPADSTIADVCDRDRMCTALEDAELWWEPGTKTGYHAYTFGYLVGEIARRVTGRRISELVRDEVAAPLGVAGELWFAMPESEQGRLAVLEDAPAAGPGFADLPADHPILRAGPMSLAPTAALGNRPDMLAAEIPAGAKTSARAITRMYAALLGNVEGVRFVSEQRLAELSTPAFAGQDEIMGMPTTWGLGYALGGPYDWANTRIFGMAGAGGSWAGADPTSGLAVAVTKNVLSADFETVGKITGLIAAG